MKTKRGEQQNKKCRAKIKKKKKSSEYCPRHNQVVGGERDIYRPIGFNKIMYTAAALQ
jgi:hypothetical protein